MKNLNTLFMQALIIATLTNTFYLDSMEPVKDVSTEQQTPECSICCNSYRNISSNMRVTTSCCNQELCLECIKSMISEERTFTCPFCRAIKTPTEIMKMVYNAKERRLQHQTALVSHLFTAQAYNQDIKSILEKSDYPYEIISTKDMFGHTAFHLAACTGQLENVKTYLEVAKEINKTEDLLAIMTKLGSTALDDARLNNHSDMIKFLSSYQQQALQITDKSLPQ